MPAFSMPNVETIFTWLVGWIVEQWPFVLAVVVMCASWLALMAKIWKEDERYESAP